MLFWSDALNAFPTTCSSRRRAVTQHTTSCCCLCLIPSKMETVPETKETTPETNNSNNNHDDSQQRAPQARHRRANTLVFHHPEEEDDDDGFTLLQNQGRSLSLQHPSQEVQKFYPRSHLMGNDFTDGRCQYFSLWLLPPKAIRKTLATEIAKLSLKYTQQGSSAAFMPHITIIGSIPCSNLREARELGSRLKKHLQHSGTVPCRFSSQECCQAMYTTGEEEKKQLVWSQSCIAMMEKSPEYMHLLNLARTVLQLPQGEWMFPAPACEPHFSKFYGSHEIPNSISCPDDFVAEEVSLWATTPGTVQGVANWREVQRIKLLSPQG